MPEVFGSWASSKAESQQELEINLDSLLNGLRQEFEDLEMSIPQIQDANQRTISNTTEACEIIKSYFNGTFGENTSGALEHIMSILKIGLEREEIEALVGSGEVSDTSVNDQIVSYKIQDTIKVYSGYIL